MFPHHMGSYIAAMTSLALLAFIAADARQARAGCCWRTLVSYRRS